MVSVSILVVIAVAIGLFIVYAYEVEKTKANKEDPGPKVHYYSEAVAARARDIEKLEGLIAAYEEKFTNQMVQKELGISAATTKKYLNELEKQGAIRQVGESGDLIYYKKF